VAFVAAEPRVTDTLSSRIHARMRALDDDGLRRTLRVPSGIDLSSNDYLGLANHPQVKARMIEAVAREGAGSTGSRLLRGNRESFAAIERRFASFKGTERALYFSSGYLANLAVLTTFPEAGDVILSDEHNHASLIDGIRLTSARRKIFPHNDVTAVRRALDATPQAGQRFLVVESLFSMDGDEAPLKQYAELCRATGAYLIVDEAHAVGIYGENGRGLVEAHGIEEDVFLSVNTAGKALGASGAFVAGPEWAIDYMIQRARPFIFSTAPPPSIAAALDASLDIVEREPQRRAVVLERARALRMQLRAAGVPLPDGTSQIVPVVLGDNDRAVAVAVALQLEGFDVRAIRPPTVAPGTARLRISVNVSLTSEQTERFVTALAAALAACGGGQAGCAELA
jgi:8-amino-7-oxononanoate synthase